MAEKLRGGYCAVSNSCFRQRVKLDREWSQKASLLLLIVETIEKSRDTLPLYSNTYNLPGVNRSGSLFNGLMQEMDQHLVDRPFFHGKKSLVKGNCHSWALVQNITPSHPNSVKKHWTYASPAERFNHFIYSGNWL